MSASRVLVYGGRGALGSAVVDYFKSKSWVSKYGGTHELYRSPVSCSSLIQPGKGNIQLELGICKLIRTCLLHCFSISLIIIIIMHLPVCV